LVGFGIAVYQLHTVKMSTETTSSEPKWEEIMGEDLLLKRVHTGTGNTAEMGTVVKCHLKGFFVENGVCQGEPFEVWKSQQFKVGENDAIPGIEMALRFSRVGDLLRVRFHPKFGYGSAGRPVVAASDGKESNKDGQTDVGAADKAGVVAIPRDTDLEYEIEVTDHLHEGQVDPEILAKFPIPPNTAGENGSGRDSERLQALTELLQRKEAGNRWFSYSDYSRAARAYSKATQVADRYFNGNANAGDPNKALQGLSVTKKDGGGQDQAAQLAEANQALAAAEQEKESQRRRFEAGDEEVVSAYLSCLNNMAACQLRLGENSKAKEVCIRVLEMDPDNHKALLRAAKAALATHVSHLSAMLSTHVLITRTICVWTS
jgi:FKBP-type peptidyl-prolyl cis-trans isomerase